MAPSQALTRTPSSATAPLFTLRTLGEFGLHRADEGLIVGPGKPLALITYLHALPGRATSRDHLLHVLWGDADESRARHALRQTVWQLRRLIGDDAFAVDTGTVALCVAIRSDVEDFLQAVEQGSLAEALALYQGEYLARFFVPGALGFEHWADTERQRFRLLFQRSAESVAQTMLSEGKLRSARDVALRIRDADPLDETGWRLLLQSILASGDRVSALTEAQRLEDALAADNRRPEPATRALLARVKAQPPNADDSDDPDIVADLVGREAQFSALVAAFRRARRGSAQVLELVAPAGFGKTRLLRDFARHIETRGHAVAYVRALPGDRDLAWSYAAEVVRLVAALPGALGISPATAATLVGLDPSLSTKWSNVGTDLTAGDEMHRRRVAAIEELVRVVSEEQPPALLLDDLHWADAVSRDALDRALTRLHNACVLTIGAYRTGASVTLTTTHETIELAPLSTADVDGLVASLGELPAALWVRHFADWLHESTSGSPLLILETLKLALDTGCLTLVDGRWQCPEPTTLERLLEAGSALSRRITRLDESEQDVLRHLAVAGAPLPTSTLVSALGIDSIRLLDVLSRLERRGFLRRRGSCWSVAHDEIGECLTDASPGRVAAAHARLGEAILNDTVVSPDLKRAAAHFDAAGSEARITAIAARWVRAARGTGDKRAAPHVVADLVGSHIDDPRVRRVVRDLPLWLRFRHARSAVFVVSAAALFVTGLLAVPSLGTPGPDISVATWQNEGGRWRMYRRQLTRSDLNAGRLAIGSLDRTDLLAPDRARGVVRPGTSHVMATTQTFPDSGGEDVVLIAAGIAPATRITTLPGDDVVGDWSPDGRYLVVQTDRWSVRSMSDLAVIEPNRDGAVVARLTSGPQSRDVWPLWSPDGTRIAFLRADYGSVPNEDWLLCVVTVDGSGEKCLRIPGHIAEHLIGWASAVELSGVFTDTSGASRILIVHTETGEFRPVAEGAATLFQSQVPGWLACFCRRTQNEPFQSLLLHVAQPEQAVRLEPGDPPPPVSLFPSRWERAYLDRLKIEGAGRSLPSDGEYQVRLRGWDANGHPAEPLGVRWVSRDTTVATVTSAGTVQPRSPGKVVIWATAGGWRSDSVEVTIAPADAASIVLERWSADYEKRWAPFGVPRPMLVEIDGGAALAPNGDSTFSSGVYLRRALPTHAGIGVEFEFSAPITARSWQYLDVKIASRAGAQLNKWDHRTGHLPLADNVWRSCGFYYPNAGRRDQLQVLAGVRRDVSVPARTSDGAWVRARVQVFEDGRCGVALNGRRVATIDRAIPLGDSALVVVEAYSHRTRILVGEISVWIGVRRDVKWRE